MARVPFKWNTANFKWNVGSTFPNQSSTPFTWDDVALIVEIAEVARMYADTDLQDDAVQNFIKDDTSLGNHSDIAYIYPLCFFEK